MARGWRSLRASGPLLNPHWRDRSGPALPLLPLSEGGGGVERSEGVTRAVPQQAAGVVRHNPGTAWLRRERYRRVSREAVRTLMQQARRYRWPGYLSRMAPDVIT